MHALAVVAGKRASSIVIDAAAPHPADREHDYDFQPPELADGLDALIRLA